MAQYLSYSNVVLLIRRALRRRKAFSLVRIGDGENLVLAQNSVWPLRRVLREPWAVKSRKGKKGVRLPNLKIRNELVRSIRKATVVGILPQNDRMIRAPSYLKRPLTNKVFRHYRLNPHRTCHACINRHMARRGTIADLFQNQRILLITKNTRRVRSQLEHHPYNLRVTGVIRFSHYSQIDRTVRKAATLKDKFDVALISCGVNAVILAPSIAERTGKMAIDFGKAPRYLKSDR